MNRDLPREVRASLTDPCALVEMLGFADGPRSVVRQVGGVIVRCPWHDERTPSCSVRVASDGTIAVRCHACGASGDVLSLIAVRHRLDLRHDFRAVLRIGAELGRRWDLLAAVDERHTPRLAMAVQQRPGISRSPERDYPPAAEVAALLASTICVSNDDAARNMLAARGLDVERIDDLALARVLPPDTNVPRWARFRGEPWTRTGHRLLVPAYAADGALRSVRAWSVRGGEPKRLPPAGHRASGLVLACPAARGVLAGTLSGLASPLRVVVVEGEPDFLTWATRFSDADQDAPVVLGVLSGSWSAEIAARIPDGAHVVVRTHSDPAGDRYAADAARSLQGRCDLFRPGRAP